MLVVVAVVEMDSEDLLAIRNLPLVSRKRQNLGDIIESSASDASVIISISSRSSLLKP